jgi:hypothetical protein
LWIIGFSVTFNNQYSISMMQSMTGFGKATGNYGNRSCTVEVRSVNSKQLDLNMRMPSALREREADLRRTITNEVVRGKVDLSITILKVWKKAACSSSIACFSTITTMNFRQLPKQKGLSKGWRLCPRFFAYPMCFNP